MSIAPKFLTLTATVLAVAVTLGAQQPAAPTAPPKPAGAPIAGQVVGEVTQWKGLVKAVDYQTRWVVVEGEQGHIHAFHVQKGVTNLDKVNSGDVVTVDFVESIAVYLRKATEPPMAAVSNTVSVKSKGLPAAAVVTVTEAQVNVTAVDQAKRTLTVVDAAGKSYTMTVDPSVAAFSLVKVGDQLVVRYSEAIAVKVTKN